MAAQESTILHLLRQSERRSADAIAIAAPGRSPVAYGRLLEHIEETIRNLHEYGIGRGDRVAIVLPNGPEMAVSFLAVSASATCAPLNPAYRANEFEFYLADIGAKALILQAGVDSPARAVAAARDIPIIELSPSLDDGAGLFTLSGSGRSVGSRKDWPQASDVALLLHTSGTTSRPKIVPLTQSNLSNSARNIASALALSPKDRCLNPMPLFHIHGLIGATLSSMSSGASVICPPAFYAPRIFEWLEELRPTWYTAVPTMHQAILTRAAANRAVIDRNPLRFIRSSSSRLPPQVMVELEKVFGAPVLEAYGMTEGSHQIAISPFPPRARKPGSVGIPSGTEVGIMDNFGRLLPPRGNGEIVIRGPSVTLGYENNPSANEKAFAQGWLRTGDLGYIDDEGYIFIVGRIKEQINRGGEKVSPLEVDEALMAHPMVQQAVTFAVPDPALGEEVGAAVVLRENCHVAERELLEFVAARLAHFKVPRHLKIVDDIPKGATGKLQRSGLAEKLGIKAHEASKTAQETFAAPTTETEVAVSRIWSEVLSAQQIGLHDNFFQLGGDSVLAALIFSRVREATGIELSLIAFYESPTVASMARSILSAAPVWKSGPASRASALPRIEPNPNERYQPFPLTDLQQGYWVGQKAGSAASNACHLYFERELVGIDLDRLQSAWQRLIDRHDVLRGYVTPDGSWTIQEKSPRYRFEVIDLSRHEADDRQRIIQETRDRMAERSPNFERWPAFEIRVHLIGDHRARMHIATNLILVDFASWAILEREWKILYESPEAVLPPLELTFRDYSLGLAAAAESPLFARAQAYWEDRVLTLPRAPSLPHRALSEGKEQRWRHDRLRFDPNLWAEIKQRGAALGVTPAMLTCSIFAETLAAFAKEPHFTLNVLTQNRHPMHPDVASLVGRCNSTLLLEVDAREPRSFAERIAKLQRQFLHDYEHRYWSGVAMTRSLNKAAGTGNQALFTTVFASMLGAGAAESVPMGWAGKLVYRCMKTPQVLFDNQVYEEGGSLISCWDMIDDAFLPGTIDDMQEAYSRLVRDLGKSKSAWEQSKLAWTRVSEAREQKLAEPDPPIPAMLLHTLFEDQARRSGEKPAIISARRTLSYSELDRCTNALAHRLRKCGVRPNKLVAIAMENGWEQVVSVLGISKAGAAYLPIDMTLVPEARVHQLLEHGEVSIVLTQTRIREMIAWPATVELIVVDESIFDQEGSRLSPIQRPEDLAYVIYTSGSTGTPKGVMIEHGPAVNTVLDVNEMFRVGEGDRVLALSSLGFDLSVWDIFGLLAAGGAIVIPSPAERMDPGSWARMLREGRVTMWNTVPKLMEMLVEYLQSRHEMLPDHLRLIMMSGDWIPISLPGRIRAITPSSPQIISLGGATEASIWSIYYPIEDIEPGWQSVPYGKGMRHQSVHVFDGELHERENCVVGQLMIGGIGLARGYWRDPERTAKSFIRLPSTGKRMYRTGDLGRYLPDGNIEFLGREDTQVKVRGYRIELGEIESVLNRHPSVEASYLLIRDADGGLAGAERVGADKQIVAYVVPQKGSHPATAELRHHLEAKLPHYMIPSFIMLIDSIPLSANGKLNRRALPAPEEQEMTGEALPELPSDEVERRIAAVWTDLIPVSRIGIHDNFFKLGGDSVLAVRMLARIRKELGVEIEVAAMFGSSAGPTIASLACLVRAGSSAIAVGPMVAIQTKGQRKPFFAMHPVGGSVLCYAKLALFLPPDQPIYGLQALRSQSNASTDVRAMAKLYVGEMRKVQAMGPYRIGGWSLGGIIAFEMARQLVAAGEQVEALVLIDSFAPQERREMPAPSAKELIAWFVRDICGRFDIELDRTNSDSANEGDQLHQAYERLRAHGFLAADLPKSDFERLYETYKNNAQSGRTYKGGELVGTRLTLIRAMEAPPDDFIAHPALRTPATEDPYLGWQRFVSDPIDLAQVPGNHYSIFNRPAIEKLAIHVNSVLRR